MDWPVATVILGVLATIMTAIMRLTPGGGRQDLGTELEVLKVQYGGLREEFRGLREELHKLREVLLAWQQQDKVK